MTADMGNIGRTLQVLLVFWISSATVSCYEDLRGMPCRNVTTYSEVPADRALWLGTIRLTMECDQGYDLPLNAPPDSTFTCLPTGATWQPDYVPDCIEKIVPDSAQMTMYGYFSKATCDGLGAMNFDNNTLTFASSHRLSLARMCSQSQLHGCTVKRAYTYCENKTTAGWLPPHIFMEVIFSIASSTSWTTYRTQSAAIALSVLRDLDHGAQSSQVNVSTQPVCQPGTVGVLRAGSEVVCRGCSLGHYLDAQNKTCLPCRPGYYADQPLSTACQLCPGMSSLLSGAVWQTINKVVPDRAHAVSGCPILYRHSNGSVEVRLPASVNIQLKKIDVNDNKKKPDPNGDPGTYREALVYLIICCLVLAALLVA